MPRITGAELVIRLLEQQGITRIAGIPGGCNLPLYDALCRSTRIGHVLARHEQGAGFMAQGMARSTGRPAVFFATSGPGATNTLTALADAKLDSIPVICITGQVPGPMIGTDAFQEVDIYGMSIAATKHNYLVRTPEELTRVIPEAFSLAVSGRPGPILIDIPKDVQTALLDVDALPQPGAPAAPLAPDPQQVRDAAARINAARQPVLLFGGGAARPRTAALARQLMEEHGIPAAMSLHGLGVVPAEHPLCLGMLGMHGARHTNILLEECDLLVVVGARFDDRATGRLDKFCSRAQVIHIDTDASEIGKLRAAHVGMTADAALALEALLPLLTPTRRDLWRERVSRLKQDHPPHMPEAHNPCSPYGIVRAVAGLLDDSAIIATDVGQHQMRAAQAYPINRTRQWLTSGGLGTMGFGLPAAIGAALANPEATVVCFTGDGSLLMNIQELATAAEEQCNVKIILCNNNALGLVQQQQDLFYEGRRFASRFGVSVNFGRVAEGFGIPALHLNASPHPLRDLEDALRRPGPCLVELDIRAEDMVFPMVPPGAANCDMIGGERHA